MNLQDELMMNTKEMIKIMQAFEDGKKIEYKVRKEDGAWCMVTFPIWDWWSYDYRIKKEPKYVPFEWEDRAQFMGKWIRRKFECDNEYAVGRLFIKDNTPCLIIEGGYIYTFEEVFRIFEFLSIFFPLNHNRPVTSLPNQYRPFVLNRGAASFRPRLRAVPMHRVHPVFSPVRVVCIVWWMLLSLLERHRHLK